jgi:hypothetical protein
MQMEAQTIPSIAARPLFPRWRAWQVILLFGLFHFVVMSFGNFVMEPRWGCVFVIPAYFMALVVVLPILILRRFGVGTAVFLPFSSWAYRSPTTSPAVPWTSWAHTALVLQLRRRCAAHVRPDPCDQVFLSAAATQSCPPTAPGRAAGDRPGRPPDGGFGPARLRQNYFAGRVARRRRA